METDIIDDLKKMRCKVFVEDDNLVTEEDITSKFTNRSMLNLKWMISKYM